ncbi:hypothetical protein PFISCL1PPCAC_11703, partial [Pristionchus fissidentatus]
QDLRHIAWIRERGGMYTVYRRMVFIDKTINIMILIIFVHIFMLVAIFAHMFYTLQQNLEHRSLQTLRAIKRSLIVLFIQVKTSVFEFVIIRPSCLLGGIIDDFFLEANLLFVDLVLLHPIGHNIILLSTTPAFRRYL